MSLRSSLTCKLAPVYRIRSQKQLQGRIDKIEKQLAKLKELEINVRMATAGPAINNT